MPEVPELLDELLRAPGPSGTRGPRRRPGGGRPDFAEVTHDALGSSIATVGDDAGEPLLAVVGHIDEIGVVVTHVDEKGFLYFASIGGWDAQILVGQRVVIDGRDGPVLGVVGRKPIHLLDADARKKVVEIKQMHIDIGAADNDEALSLISIGDAGVVAGEPAQLAGSRLASRSMDNSSAATWRSRQRAARTSAASSGREWQRSQPFRRRSARWAPVPPPMPSAQTWRSPSTLPTQPTRPASTRRRWAATRSAQAR